MAVRRRVEEEWDEEYPAGGEVEHTVIEERFGLSAAMRMRNLLMSLVGAALAVVLVLLGTRVLLLLFDANMNNSFADLIFNLTAPLVAPFESIANDRAVGDGLFEVSTIVAMGAYLAGAVLALFVLGAVFSWSEGEERTTAERRARL